MKLSKRQVKRIRKGYAYSIWGYRMEGDAPRYKSFVSFMYLNKTSCQIDCIQKALLFKLGGWEVLSKRVLSVSMPELAHRQWANVEWHHSKV